MIKKEEEREITIKPLDLENIWQEPLLHTFVEDIIPDWQNDKLVESIYCKECEKMLHCTTNNECMNIWIETKGGNFCLECFVKKIKNFEENLKGKYKYVYLEDVKSACEFYLKYFNNPKLLIKEHPKYKKEFEKFFTSYEILLKEYNKWLFKLTFKPVFKKSSK